MHNDYFQINAYCVCITITDALMCHFMLQVAGGKRGANFNDPR